MTSDEPVPVSDRATPGVIGRDDESMRLAVLVDSLAAGQGSAIAIEGLPGMGKSTLVAGLFDRATAAGVRVVRATCNGLTATSPWAVATTLVDALAASLTTEGESPTASGPASRAWELLESTPSTGQGTAFPIVHGIVCAMRDTVELRPVLVVVDDAHLCDECTLPVIASLADRTVELPIGIVITYRPSAGSGGDGLEHTLAGGAFEHLRLAPLPDASIAAIAAAWAPGAGDELRREIVRAAGGNPLLAREAAEMYEHHDEPADPAPEPGGDPTLGDIVAGDSAAIIRRSTLNRLGASGVGAHQVAAAIAVLGTNADVARTAALAGVDHHTALTVIDELRRHGVVDYADQRPAIRHALVEQMILADIGSPHLEALHHAAAVVLRADGASSEDVVRHLMRARGVGDPEPWMPALLRRSASRQLALGSAATAADLLARARALSDDPVERMKIRLEQARAEGAAGLPTAAERLDAIVDEISAGSTAPSARELRVFSAVGDTQFTNGEFDRAEHTYDRGLQLICTEYPNDAAAITTTNESMNASVARLLAGRSSSAVLAGHRSRLDASIDDLARRRRGTPSVALRVLAARRAGERALGIDVDPHTLDLLIATALYGEIPEFLVRPVYEPVSAALILAGLPGEAHALLTDLLDRAADRGEAASHISLLPIRAQAALIAGDVDGALSDALDALRLLDEVPTGSTYPGAPARYIAALAYLERDDREAAASVVNVRDATEQFGTSPMFGWFACGVGAVMLDRGDAVAAERAFRDAGRAFTAGGGSGTVVGWRNGLARALHAQGNIDEPIRLLGEEAAAAAKLGDTRLSAENRRVAATLERDHLRAADMLAEVVAELDEATFPLDVAAADVERGMRLRRLGERRAARDALRIGMDRARQTGSRRLVRVAADELEAAGSRRPRAAVSGRHALTPAEYRVCTLATQGRTNREIANMLFVGIKTIETQLSSAYRKLGVSGRDGLEAALVP